MQHDVQRRRRLLRQCESGAAAVFEAHDVASFGAIARTQQGPNSGP
jgi:hypothetical protein